MSWNAVCLTLAICGSNPQTVIAKDHVDLVEVNHHYDEQGRLLFDQVIFYEWSPDQQRYNVRDWRLVKSPSQLPVRQSDGSFLAVWHDDRILRRVQARTKTESWTQYDPELVERQFLARNKRVNLTKQLMTGKLHR